MQYYNFHFTYTTGGDVYYGSGYRTYSTSAGAYTSNQTIAAGLGTYTIDYAGDTTWGIPDQVNVYQYNDVNGVGTRNSIDASGTSGLGSESGVVTDFGGNKASFNNATAVTLSSTAKMQQLSLIHI